MKKDYYDLYYELPFREELLKELILKLAEYIIELYNSNQLQNYDYINIIKNSVYTKDLDISLREEDYLVNELSKKLLEDYSFDLVKTSPMTLEAVD